MTTITILPERVEKDRVTYRAIAGAKQSSGQTAGEALDALTRQLSEDEAGLLVVVQNLRPDHLFTTGQQQRLSELMERWRAARDRDDTLSTDEQLELEDLVDAELKAATRRAESVLSHLDK